MARTDAHRPSAINPEDYDFVACDYYGPWASLMFVHERKAFRDHMERTGGKHVEKYNSGSCHICGAAAMYVAKYHHRPSNTYIVTGMDCAEKMDFGGTGAFRKFRTQVSHERKIYKGKALAKEVLALLGLSDAWKYYENGAFQEGKWGREESIIQSIVAKQVRYNGMTEKQADLVRKLLGDIADRPRKEAERAAQRVAEVAASDWIGQVGERLVLDLTVSYTTNFETQFGIMHVHSMRDDKGNVVVYKGGRIADKGQRIRIKATVKEHGTYKDLRQTIVSRPKVEAVL